jgi:hypothetical protein
MSRARRVGFAVASVLLSLGLLEGCSRAAIWAIPAVKALTERSFEYKIPDSELGLRGNPEFVDHDEAGWRNATRPDRVSVVAVGDSQTYGSEVSRYDAWPQIAARESAVSIYNIAIGGFGPYQYWRLIDDALALSPELILVAFYDGNDYFDSWSDVYRAGRHPEMLTPDLEQRAELLALEERSPLHADWAATRRVRKGSTRADFLDFVGWLERSVAVFKLVRGVVVAVSGPGDPPESRVRRQFAKYSKVAAGSDPGLLVAFEDGDRSTIFTPRGRLATLDPSDPRVRESERLTFSFIDRILAAVGDRASLAFVLIPTKELVYADRVRESGQNLHESYRQLLEGERTLRDRLKTRLDTSASGGWTRFPKCRQSWPAAVPPTG